MSVLALLPDGVAGEDWPALAPDGDEEAARAVRQARLAFPAGGRLQMLNPVREFVQSHYPPDEADAARAAAHYVGLANECGWIETNIGRMFNGQTAMPRFRPDAANLETMILRSLAGGLSSANLTAANALAEFGSYSGLPLDAPLRRAAELCGEDRQWQLEKANCVQSLGDIALRRSDHDAARKLYEQAQPLYAQVGDVLGQANCVQSLGDIALRRSDHDAARKLYEQAQPLYAQVGDVLGQANCVKSLGDIEREAGRGAAARGLYHDALTQYRRIQEPYSIGVTFYRLAQVADDDTERARCVNEARAAWLSIKREDLVEILDKEFGEGI